MALDCKVITGSTEMFIRAMFGHCIPARRYADKMVKVQEWGLRPSLTLSFCAHRAVYSTELWYPRRSKEDRVKYRKGDLCTRQLPHTLLTSQWDGLSADTGGSFTLNWDRWQTHSVQSLRIWITKKSWAGVRSDLRCLRCDLELHVEAAEIPIMDEGARLHSLLTMPVILK